jgi:hypothetical protein
MHPEQRFTAMVIQIARQLGYRIELSRDGRDQIDFGTKKLHAGHLARLFPDALTTDVDVARLIERVAPGRPCTHPPMRQIIGIMLERPDVGDLLEAVRLSAGVNLQPGRL